MNKLHEQVARSTLSSTSKVLILSLQLTPHHGGGNRILYDQLNVLGLVHSSLIDQYDILILVEIRRVLHFSSNQA